jgi:hypothetical protein
MKNLFVRTLIFLLITTYVACKGKEEGKPATVPASVPAPPTDNDSVNIENVDTVLTSETIRFFDHSGFSDYTRSGISAFDWSKFRLVNVWKEDSMIVAPFKLDESFLRNYGSLIRYSPDSSMFIDLDSYNIDISRNSKGQLVGKEIGPDSEVSLVDLNTKERRRLVFLGPDGSIDEGGWLDKETIVLAGMQDNADAGKTAVIWKYHIPTNTFFMYELPVSADIKQLMNDWTKKRLKDVQIER